MILPLIQKNKKLFAYKQWLSEKRLLGKVTPMEFISFKYKHYRTGKPYPFTINGENFIGEVWKCFDENGEWVECTFKHYIDIAFKAESSLSPNKHPIQDGFQPNLLTDSYEEFCNNMVNKLRNPNKHLNIINKKHKNKLSILRELVNNGDKEEKEMAFYLLRHKESPTIPTLRSVQKIRTEKPELYNHIMQKIQHDN